MSEAPTLSGIEQAVAKAGGYMAFVRSLRPVEKRDGTTGHISRQVVYMWVKRGWVPMLRAVEIEDLYGIDRALLVKPALRVLVGEPSYQD
jgi:hypothetical protein